MPDTTTATSVLFHSFQNSIEGIDLPDRFTFPYYYEPHPLCIIAAEELQQRIETQEWKRDFGLNGDTENSSPGKMFGVLVVQNHDGAIGYLTAFSGQLDEAGDGFVPFVYQLPEGENFFTRGSAVITAFGEQIEHAKNLPEMAAAKIELDQIKAEALEEIAALRESMRLAKADRKLQRSEGEKNLSTTNLAELEARLANDSRKNRFILKAELAEWSKKVEAAQQKSDRYENAYSTLVGKRAQFSADLQQQLFEKYRFLNRVGESKSLLEIFNGNVQPPAGAGDCAAPKLLQYAFANGLKPIAMAEFWWGESPKTTIRRHKKYYPACLSKCKPILTHMLAGIELDPNPMILEHGQNKTIETVYEDEYILLVNKPFGLLSVPGKEIEDSVLSRMKIKYPEATGPLLVHRLDMDTSGLILIAKSIGIHKKLQAQFLKRKVKKRYVALLEGECLQGEGTLDLPLRVDLDDRPNQMVCFEHGKRAITRFEVIEVKDGKSRIYFYPHTGRTHQLRVHAAHPLGLNCPIVGDILYGQDSDRMYLHAEMLEFEHPVTKKRVKFVVEGGF